MANLIIGLCFGAVAAAALLVMWRMAEKLERNLRSEQNLHEQVMTDAGPEAEEHSPGQP